MSIERFELDIAPRMSSNRVIGKLEAGTNTLVGWARTGNIEVYIVAGALPILQFLPVKLGRVLIKKMRTATKGRSSRTYPV
ncbi:hypothetical protein GYMLUDRAFT_35653 [Collybiopsis luxurians FD-317 M1]|nr:hypothetical protein GYMLUDRAFT_35653 [Collybiopsis luxurians FD-317 M1]